MNSDVSFGHLSALVESQIVQCILLVVHKLFEGKVSIHERRYRVIVDGTGDAREPLVDLRLNGVNICFQRMMRRALVSVRLIEKMGLVQLPGINAPITCENSLIA